MSNTHLHAYRINECEWYAATSIEEAIALACEDSGLTEDLVKEDKWLTEDVDTNVTIWSDTLGTKILLEEHLRSMDKPGFLCDLNAFAFTQGARVLQGDISQAGNEAEQKISLLDKLMHRLLDLAHQARYTEAPIKGWVAPPGKQMQFSLGDVKLPGTAITEHMTLFGATRTGKSQALFALMNQVRAQKYPLIAYDKKGEFTERYYRAGKDILLSPFDKRAPAWNIWRELRYVYDASHVAAALWPLKPQGEKFWDQNAAIVFADTLRVLATRGNMTNRALHEACNVMPLADYHKLLKGTQAAGLMDPKNEKTAMGIRATMTAALQVLPMLRDDKRENTFSIRDYISSLDDGNDAWLFLPSRGDAHTIVKPMISLWVEIAAAGILSLPTGEHRRRLFVVLDELASLPRLESLPTLMQEGAGYGVSIWNGVQNYSQNKESYGDNIAETLIANSKTLLILNTPEPTSAEFLSKAIGDRRLNEKTVSRQVSESDERDSLSLGATRKQDAAIIPGAIMNFRRRYGVLKIPDVPSVMVTIPISRRRPIAERYVDREDITWDHVLQLDKAARDREKQPVPPAPTMKIDEDGVITDVSEQADTPPVATGLMSGLEMFRAEPAAEVAARGLAAAFAGEMQVSDKAQNLWDKAQAAKAKASESGSESERGAFAGGMRLARALPGQLPRDSPRDTI